MPLKSGEQIRASGMILIKGAQGMHRYKNGRFAAVGPMMQETFIA